MKLALVWLPTKAGEYGQYVGGPWCDPPRSQPPAPEGSALLALGVTTFLLFTTYIYILKQYGLACLFLNFNEQINTTLLFCVFLSSLYGLSIL